MAKWICKAHRQDDCVTKLPCVLNDGARTKTEREDVTCPTFCPYNGFSREVDWKKTR
jgi:hypothetical protein